jgi:hypothetical protein
MDWYEQLREENPWLPPPGKVLEAELTYGPDTRRCPTMVMRVAVALPKQPERTWAGSLPVVPRPARNALPDALALVAMAMEATNNGRGCRAQLLEAGAQVRAMVPANEVWSAAYQRDGRDVLSLLREAVNAIVQGADWQQRDNPERGAMWLRAADAILHGLWLEAR